MKRKILIVSNAFYPEISPRSFRATELTKEFYRQGHDITVITKFRYHEYSAFLEKYRILLKMWPKALFPTLPNFRNKYLSSLSRGISRLLSVLFEYPNIEETFQVKKMLKRENNYDLMISFAVPYTIHWGVAWSRSNNHPIASTWIADCGDPYMGDVLDSFKKPFYFGYLEKNFCRKADFITIPVESATAGYYPEFHHKIKIIPQGFDFELKSKANNPQKNDIPEFAYAGGFLRGIRDPGPLMEFLVNCNKNFKFHVFTQQPELLEHYKSSLGNKLIISDYIERDLLMMKLSEMDFLINFDNNTKLNIPSKLIDYAITNRPVLNIDKNFDFENLQAFLNGDYRRRMLLPTPEQYHIKNVSKQFLNLIIPEHLNE